jgi:hypothetical protein
MLSSREPSDALGHILFFYETRIQSIGSALDTTYHILQGFQDVLVNTNKEREKISKELKECLAKNESLRRKDFDTMMEGILQFQNEREKEVKNLLNLYFDEQRDMASALRENLKKFKDSLAHGETQRIKEFQDLIKELLARQLKRKEDVTTRLKEFQNEQRDLAWKLKVLAAKGKELRIRDLKLMLKEFQAQHKERRSRQEERREIVRTLLDAFKEKRTADTMSWRDKKKPQKQASSARKIHPVGNDPERQNFSPLTGLSNGLTDKIAPNEGADMQAKSGR